MNDVQVSTLCLAIRELAESNRALADANRVKAGRDDELSDAIRLQTLGLHALADAIAAPVEGEQEEEQGDGVERYMNGEPIE